MPRISFFNDDYNPQCPLCGWKPTQKVPGGGLVVECRPNDERTTTLIECDQCFCESVCKAWVDDNSFNSEISI